MTAAILAQLKALTPAPVAATPAGGTPIAPAGLPSTGAKLSIGRETPKEQPGAKPCRVRWNEAGALFREQHKGMFRIVVVGHESDTARVIAALDALNP